MTVYVLDTSAVSAFLRQERGYEIVEGVLEGARDSREHVVHIPFMTIMEIEYTSLRHESEETVKEWLDLMHLWPAQIVELDAAWRHVAAMVKSTYRLSLADAWVGALALIREGELLHKDPEFDAVEGLRSLRLPYDREARR